MQLIDQSCDAGSALLYRIERDYGIPAHVKAAARGDLYDPSLGPQAYGDPDSRRLPAHTPEATWLSSAYLLAQRGSLPAEKAAACRARLRRLADFHGCRLELDALEGRAEALLEKEAADAAAGPFALPGRYPLRTLDQLEEGRSYFLTYRDRMDYPTRRLFADNLLKRAGELHADIPDADRAVLEKSAGHGLADSASVAGKMLERVQAARAGGKPDGGVAVALLKLARHVAASPGALRGAFAEKVAAALDAFDRAHGFDAHYAGGFPRPEEVVYAAAQSELRHFKEASARDALGRLWRLDDLERLPLRRLRDALGDEAAGGLTADWLRVDRVKAAAALPALPRPAAEQFGRLCGSLGVYPWALDR